MRSKSAPQSQALVYDIFEEDVMESQKPGFQKMDSDDGKGNGGDGKR
jgi:hypothetical protein